MIYTAKDGSRIELSRFMIAKTGITVNATAYGIPDENGKAEKLQTNGDLEIKFSDVLLWYQALKAVDGLPDTGRIPSFMPLLARVRDIYEFVSGKR